jgi:hypothetical protein
MQDVINTRTATVFLLKDNLVKMEMNEGAILELVDMIENHDAENQVANHKPHAILIDTRLNSVSSDEARKFSSGDEPTKYRIAVALLFDGLSGRIVANSLINHYHPKVPTQKFTDENEAVKWLESQLP